MNQIKGFGWLALGVLVEVVCLVILYLVPFSILLIFPFWAIYLIVKEKWTLLQIAAGLIILVSGIVAMILETVVFLLVGFVIGGFMFLVLPPLIESIIWSSHWSKTMVRWGTRLRRYPHLTLKVIRGRQFWPRLWLNFKETRRRAWSEVRRNGLSFTDWLALTDTALGNRGGD